MPPAHFLFHGSLNDFLPAKKKVVWLSYAFNHAQAIKDAIEAMGVPHPEVAIILVNHQPVSFPYLLQTDDRVEVYPLEEAHQWPEGYSLVNTQTFPEKFVLDVHLGSLAKALRLLGFDTCYQKDYADTVIAQIAVNEQRIVLTRDIGLLKHKAIKWGHWLRSQFLEEQLKEVIAYYKLSGKFKPFYRCLVCNEPLAPVNKEEVLNQLPPNTIEYFHEFYQCPNCKRVYWKGSHYERMQQFIERIQKSI